MKTIYRIEKEYEGHGMWYNNKGEYSPEDYPTTKDLAMPFDQEFIRGKEPYFCGTKDREQFKEWFPDHVLKDLIERGYRAYEIVVLDYIDQGNQVLYLKSEIISQKKVEIS